VSGHKYNAKRTQCSEGHSHPSKGEAKRCGELHLLQRAGHIRGLVYQPQYWFHIDGEILKHPNGRRVGYRPDWRYFEDNQTIAEEFKGFRTPDYALRIAIFKAMYRGIVHRETGRA
jgi:hypothetical protein